MKEFYPIEQTKIHLSASQNGAQEEIKKASPILWEKREQSVFLLSGLPGVGKSQLIENTTEAIKNTGGSASDYDLNTVKKIKNSKGLSVITATPLETEILTEKIKDLELPADKFTTHIMPGMTFKEMATFLNEGTPRREPTIDLIKNTMGIPQLGMRVATLRGDTQRPAIEYVSKLDLIGIDTSDYESTREALIPYLHILPSQEIYEKAQDYRTQDKEESYPVKLSDRKCQEYGQPSARFVDTATLDIYRKARNLTWEQLNQADTKVVIYAPHLSKTQHRTVTQSFGLSLDNYYFAQGDIPDALASSPRGRLFHISGMKISIDLHTLSSTKTNHDKDHLTIYRSEPTERINLFQVQRTEPTTNTTTSITLGCRDYPQLNYHPRKFSHMVESLFQNIGVSYTAYNGIANTIYTYDSSERKINIVS